VNTTIIREGSFHGLADPSDAAACTAAAGGK